MKPRSTQASIARWGFAFVGSSIILPFIGLLTFSSADLANPFWLKCAGLVVFAVAAGWLLRRLEKGTLDRPVIGWCIVASYFVTIFSVIWSFFNGATSALFLFGSPEICGLITCLVGIIRFILTRIGPGEQIAAGNRP